MNCVHCHSVSAANAKFCQACGKPLIPAIEPVVPPLLLPAAASPKPAALPPFPRPTRQTKSSDRFLKSLFDGYKVVAVAVAICSFIGVCRNQVPSFTTTASFESTSPGHSILKGILWPVSLTVRVGIKHESLREWFFDSKAVKDHLILGPSVERSRKSHASLSGWQPDLTSFQLLSAPEGQLLRKESRQVPDWLHDHREPAK